MKILLLLCLITLSIAFDDTYYEHSAQLSTVNDEFVVYWNVVDDEIELAMKVQTEGWIALGFSEPTSGSMPGADVIHGFVDASGVYIYDRYSVEFAEPLLDDCQDWGVVSGEESDGFTIIEVVRKLKANDVQDRDIHEGYVRLIWAYGNDDTFGYHAQRRATALTFYGVEPVTDITFLLEEEGVVTFNFTNDDYEVPAERTHYGETYVAIPFAYKVHIVGIDFIIDPNTIANVHHFVLRGYYEDESYEDIWEWAPGILPLIMPEGVGFLCGPGAYVALRLQTHFDNPERKVLLDNSGLKIYYTPNLREQNAGVVVLGDPGVLEQNPIASGIGFQSYQYSCPNECTSMWPYDITVFSSFLHMHSSGSQIWTTHWRGDEKLSTTNRIDFWDSDFQQQTTVSFVVQPGDRLNTHCVYRKLSSQVPFGQGSDEEMCMDFISYYPKIENNAFCGHFYDPSTPVYCNGTEQPFDLVMDEPNLEYVVFGSEQAEDHECPVNDYIQSLLTSGTNSEQIQHTDIVSEVVEVSENDSDDEASNAIVLFVTVAYFMILI